MIIVIDYKMGNVASIINMLKRINARAKLSSDIEDIQSASKLILPGVGAFDTGMTNLRRGELLSALTDKVLIQKTPVLGICLGMELLTDGSEEGNLPGLGWIEGSTVRFKFGPEQARLKIPHMGWNGVMFRRECIFSDGYEEEPRFYFVHSYHVVCKRDGDIAGRTLYGYEFTSAVHKANIYGVQFHPEKSHKFGMKLLKAFVEL